jgi:hypothetical protein
MGVAAQTGMLLAMLLHTLLAASVVTSAQHAEAEASTLQLLQRAEVPPVTSLSKLALLLQRHPPPVRPSLRGVAQLVAKMELPGLALSPGLVRLECLGADADSSLGLVYAALLWLSSCVRCVRHAKNRPVFMLLVLAVVYPALEVLHPEALRASDLDRQLGFVVAQATEATTRALLAGDEEPDGTELQRAMARVAVALARTNEEDVRRRLQLASESVAGGLDTLQQLALL